MSRDKQIEEMAKAIYNLDHCEGYKDDRGCMYAPSCSICKYGRENKAKQISELLTKNGYRKASEVAREIFEEIETLIVRRMIPEIAWIDDRFITDFAELKKKYIGKDTNAPANTEEGK